MGQLVLVNTTKKAVYRNTDEPECSLTERLLPPVLCKTLGRCCTFSWVRGDTGECWWLYGWEEGLAPLLPLPPLLLAKLCSVPVGHKQIGLYVTLVSFTSVLLSHFNRWKMDKRSASHLVARWERALRFQESRPSLCRALGLGLALFPGPSPVLFRDLSLGPVHAPSLSPARGPSPSLALCHVRGLFHARVLTMCFAFCSCARIQLHRIRETREEEEEEEKRIIKTEWNIFTLSAGLLV